jgi:hypothetical protein
MLYKLDNAPGSILFMILISIGCNAQDSNLTEILRKPEEYQRIFVADYLKFPVLPFSGVSQNF